MAPNVSVPMNFGIRLLDSPTHNTLELKASQGAIVKASSVILSLNSPVIDNMTTMLHLTSLDVEEFSEEAVRSFVNAAYTGETPTISRDTFKDLNKLANVFEVPWLVAGCVQQFSQIAESILQPSYPDLLFLFEEAAFVRSQLKSRQLVDIALKTILSLNWKREFIGKYLEDVSTRSTYQLDIVIELAGIEVQYIVKPLIDQLVTHIDVQGAVLPTNCKYLLQNSELSLCQRNNTEVFEQLFDILHELSAGSIDDMTWVFQLHRKASKELVQFVKSAVPTTSSKSDDSQQSPSNVIPNLFHTLDCNKMFDELVNWLGESKHVTNLCMFLEGLWTWMWANDKANVVCTPAVLEKISEIRARRGWKLISSRWLDYRYNSSYSRNFFDKLKACRDLCKPHRDTTQWDYLRCEKPDNVTMSSIFEQETKLVFHFEHPAVKECSKRGKCGFIIRTTPAKDGASMILCTDPSNYSEDIHFHEEVRAEDMHLILFSYARSGRIPISWCGMPRVENYRLVVNMLPVTWFNEDNCGFRVVLALQD